MSVGLAVFAVTLVLGVGAAVVYAFWDLVEERRERRRDAREAAHAERAFQVFDPPPIRPAVPPPAGPWWPVRVAQLPAAEVADRPTAPLTDKERHRFDVAVAALKNVPAVRSAHTQEDR